MLWIDIFVPALAVMQDGEILDHFWVTVVVLGKVQGVIAHSHPVLCAMDGGVPDVGVFNNSSVKPFNTHS